MTQQSPESANQGPPEPSAATRQLARSLTVILARVAGTGPDGQITRQDVLDHHAAMVARGRKFSQMREARAGRNQPSGGTSAAPAAPAAPRKPSWSPPAGVDPRVYAANPLVDEARHSPSGRRAIAAAEKRAAAPTLFTGGDLPPFTASGLDPQELLKVPWYARPALAAVESKEEALELLAVYAGPDGDVAAQADRVAGHPGVADYVGRVRDWLAEGERVARESATDQQYQQAVAARRTAAQARKTAEKNDTFDHLFSRQVPADERGSR
jgi:hypothetical protein